MTATAEDMKAVIEKYGNFESAESSGNYTDDEHMIEIDTEPLGIMLMCSEQEFYDTLFNMAAATIEERIKESVLNNIEKTKDFKFIC